jgi:MscS family membrane protein
MEKLDSIIYFGNSLTSWLIALAFIVGSVILARIVKVIFSHVVKKYTASTENDLDDKIAEQIEEPISLAIVLLGFWFAYSHLVFQGSGETIAQIFQIAFVLDLTWLLSRLLDALVEALLIRSAARDKSSMINQIGPILRKSVRSIVWILGVITSMNNAGYDVAALLAGVGIGGLALAMAAKDFVANIFGGIAVFVDKPFQVGDRIVVNGIDGTVQEIGIRSSRLITLEGRRVTIPNNSFTNSPIENITTEPSRKVPITLGLTYDTAPEKVQLAIAILKEIVGDHTETENDFTVFFSSFGEFSLNITCHYYINHTGHWATTPGEINLSILQKFNAEKLDFAFPTQTIITQS